MKKLLSLFYPTFILIILSSCQSSPGDPVTEKRELNGFTKVRSAGSFDVYIEKAEEFEVIVTAGDRIMPRIITEVDGKTLKIKTKNLTWFRKTGDVTVDIKMPALEGVKLSGSGHIVTNDEFDAGVFGAEISGSGEIRIKGNFSRLDAKISGSGELMAQGKAKSLKADISGSGDIDAIAMPVADADVKISGSGDVSCEVSDNLRVKISGSGDVFYRGQPKVETDISGSGNVEPYE